MTLKADDIFEMAKQLVFDEPSMGDVSAQLGATVTRYGVAKILWVRQMLGLKLLACFVGAADMCAARNVKGNEAGFGYGGKFSWGDGTEEIVVLDSHPNACGALVASLSGLPEVTQVLERIENLRGAYPPQIDGITIGWDVGRRNHFLRVDEVKALVEDLNLPSYTAVVHCSARELKADTRLGPGLYLEESQWLREQAKRFETPWGPLRLLMGDSASRYWQQHQLAADFARRRRELFARELFGDLYQGPVIDRMHQGLISMNSMLLGAQSITDDLDGLYLVACRADLPMALVRPRGVNLTTEQMRQLGILERAGRSGVTEPLQAANILPHGGGYSLPGQRVGETIVAGGQRFYSIVRNGVQVIFPSIRWEEFTYRGLEVVERVTELSLAEVVAWLRPLWSAKID